MTDADSIRTLSPKVLHHRLTAYARASMKSHAEFTEFGFYGRARNREAHAWLRLPSHVQVQIQYPGEVRQ